MLEFFFNLRTARFYTQGTKSERHKVLFLLRLQHIIGAAMFINCRCCCLYLHNAANKLQMTTEAQDGKRGTTAHEKDVLKL